MAELNDQFKVLTHVEVAHHFGIEDRTLRDWISAGYFPRKTTFGKKKGWRKGQIEKWMEATEFLQGLGLTRLTPPEEEDEDSDHGNLRQQAGSSRRIPADEDSETSQTRKPR